MSTALIPMQRFSLPFEIQDLSSSSAANGPTNGKAANGWAHTDSKGHKPGNAPRTVHIDSLPRAAKVSDTLPQLLRQPIVRG